MKLVTKIFTNGGSFTVPAGVTKIQAVLNTTPLYFGSFSEIHPVGVGSTTAMRRASDGSAWTVGTGTGGQLGDNTAVSKSSPVSVVGGFSFSKVMAGNQHMVALRQSDGSVWSWGTNSSGVLGDGSLNNRSSPVSMAGGTSWSNVAAGVALTTLLKSDGSLWGLGANSQSQFLPSNTNTVPGQIANAGSFRKVVTGNFGLALKPSDGSVWSWGTNSSGELGQNTQQATLGQPLPGQVVGGISFTDIAMTVTTGLGLRGSDGSVWAWGANSGFLGITNTAQTMSSPVSVAGGHSFVSLVAGGANAANVAMGLKSDGSVWIWGNANANSSGQSGYPQEWMPRLMVADQSFAQIGVFSNQAAAGLRSSDGSVWGWGFNYNGVLGQGATGPAGASSPVSVQGGNSYMSIATGNSEILALRGSDGSLWAWGANSNGQLGNNSVSNFSSPVSVLGGISFSKIATSGAASYGIRGSDGSVWAWGNATNGALGNLSITANASSPISVVGGFSFSQIYAAANAGTTNGRATAIRSSDGSAWAWGYGVSGALGINSATDRSSPTSVVGGISFSKLALGSSWTMGIRGSDGSAWAWGGNSSGQLGNNAGPASVLSPVSVVGGHSFIELAAIAATSYGLKADGTVWAWGANNLSQLGRNNAGAPAAISSPVQVTTNVSFSSFSNSGSNQADSMFALRSNGEAWGWGANTNVQLGYLTAIQNAPKSLVGGFSFSQIVAGSHSMGLRSSDGSVWAWGAGGAGQLGNNTITNQSSPVSVLGGYSFTKIAAGAAVAVGLRSDGQVLTWGTNTNGSLGDGTVTGKSSPISVIGGHSFVDVHASASTVYALKADGSVWGWGTGTGGELGNGATTNSSSPVSVSGNMVFSSFTVGGQSATTGSAIKSSDGTVWTWGSNTNGQLGRFTTFITSPVSISTGVAVSQLAAPGNTISVLDTTGNAWGSGDNSSGQIGDGTLDSPSSPVSTLGNNSFVQIAAGLSHTLGRKSDGSVWGWGANTNAMLNPVNIGAPNPVFGSISFKQLVMTTTNGAGLKASDGSAWTWGSNASGQIGDNTSISTRLSPVSVVGGISFSKIAVFGNTTANTGFVGLRGSDGSAWAWGSNANFCLGAGAVGNASSPVSVKGGISYSDISCGVDFVAAIRGSDGFVYTWGNNTNACVGQTQDTVLSQVLSESSFSQVSSGTDQMLAVRPSDGSVWAWGNNANGQLGDGTVTLRSSPVSVQGGLSFTQVAAGSLTSFGLRSSDGSVWGWGDNTGSTAGKLGQLFGSVTASTSSPVSIAGGISFKQVAAGFVAIVAGIKGSDGSAWVWGQQSGLYTFPQNWAPRPIDFPMSNSFATAVVSRTHGLALRGNDGSVWAWGFNNSGQLGNNTISDSSSPVSVVGGISFSQLVATGDSSSGWSHGLRSSDGSAWSWGLNGNGQLGDNTVTNRSSPVSVVGGISFKRLVSAISDTSAGLRGSDGSVWVWGSGGFNTVQEVLCRPDFYPALGVSSPISIAGGISFASIASNGQNMFGIRGSDGSAWGWGATTNGQLGYPQEYAPRPTVSSISFISISGGYAGGIGLRLSDGSAWTWGTNNNGALGNNTVTNSFSPQSVVGGISFKQIAAGGQFGQGYTGGIRTSDGSAWTWGNNTNGQLGNNTITSASSPVSVVGGISFAKISLGETCTTALRSSDGSVWTWGTGTNGELGNNAITNRSSPVSVVGGISFVDIATTGGLGFTAARKSDGSVWMWGNGGSGRLGNNTITSTSSPVSVVGGFNFSKVACGEVSTIALRGSDGSAWAWGSGGFGQLGNNTTNDSSSPVSVVGGHSFVDVACLSYGNAGIKANGEIWAWGTGAFGQIGNSNSLADASSPVLVTNPLLGSVGFKQIAPANGTNMVFALKTSDGTVWSWGTSNTAALGYQTSSYNYPKSIPGGISFTKIVVSTGGIYGIRGSDNSLWAWGTNTDGQLGDNTQTHKSSPVSVVGGHTFIDIGGMDGAAIGLKANGEIWGWGNGSSGNLGFPNSNLNYSSPVLVTSGYKTINSTNTFSSVATKTSDGTVWSWGSSTLHDATLGYPSSVVNWPQSLPGAISFKQISVSQGGVGVRGSDGSAWAWGLNSFGQLGDNTITTKSSPVSVLGGISFTKVSCGPNHAIGIRGSDGSAWAWGLNTNGRLGDNTITNRSSPVSVVGGFSFVDVSAGSNVTMGLRGDGKVLTWGQGAYLGLGVGATITDRSSPAIVGPTIATNTWSSINVNGVATNAAAIESSTGLVYTWGTNTASSMNGYYSTFVIRPRNMPYNTTPAFPSTSSAVQVVGGANHASVILGNGTRANWGLGTGGVHGDNTTTTYAVVTYASDAVSYSKVVSGVSSQLGLRSSDGSVWAWGSGVNGQLGQGSNTSAVSLPVSVVGGHSFVDIAAVNNAGYGLKADGTIWTWGAPSVFPAVSTSSPVTVSTLAGPFTKLVSNYDSGNAFGAIKTSDGTAATWGDTNTNGQLGNAGGTIIGAPVSINTNGVSFSKLAVGAQHQIGLRSTDGSVWAWGLGTTGQLGVGGFSSQSSPVSVVGGHSFIDIGAVNNTSFGIKSDGSVWSWGTGSQSPDYRTTAWDVPTNISMTLTDASREIDVNPGDTVTTTLNPNGTWTVTVNGKSYNLGLGEKSAFVWSE